MSSTQEKLEKLRSDAYNAARGDLDTDHPEGVHCLDIVWEQLMRLIDSAKREVLEEMRPANATIESMRMYAPRTHTYMGKEYPACSICGFCPEAMNAFIDAQLEQSEEEK